MDGECRKAGRVQFLTCADAVCQLNRRRGVYADSPLPLPSLPIPTAASPAATRPMPMPMGPLDSSAGMRTPNMDRTHVNSIVTAAGGWVGGWVSGAKGSKGDGCQAEA